MKKRNSISEVQKYFNLSLHKNGRYEILSKKTGKIKLIKHYSNNTLEGQYIFYWDNGNIMIEGNFKKNRREGLWLNYDFNGELILKENY